MSEAIDFKVVGTRPVRPDGTDKVTGRAAFGADFTLPGMIHGAVLRSPHAHARIRSIDTSAARAMPGVKAVLTGADLPRVAGGAIEGGEGGGDYAELAVNVMAREKALYEGHAVAAVAATTLAQAQAALGAIVVDYEVLEPVLDIEAAMRPGAPLVDEHRRTQGLDEEPTEPSNVAQRLVQARGDVRAAFAEADVIVEGDFVTPLVHQGYIEPHACVARAGADGRVTLWNCTQGHFDDRTNVARILNIPVADVKVIPSEIGGGFGGKTTVYLEPVAVALSRGSGRPVKMVMGRDEVFRATGPAPATRSRFRVGAKNDGTLVAIEGELFYEDGCFPGTGAMLGLMCATACYRTPNISLTGWSVVVNKPRTCAYRAPGAPQAVYPVESLMDELARRLGMDPIDLRLANAVDEGDEAVYGVRFGPVGLRACLEAAKNHPNYRKPLGEHEGRGVSAAFWFNAGMQSSAQIHVNEDGTVTVVEGSPDIGGSRASMALMAAEELGIPYEKVRVLVADTEAIGFNSGTGGSRTTFATGMAVIEAARDVVGTLKARAAAVWKCDPDMVDWQDGQAVPAPGQNLDVQPLTLAEIAAGAGRTGGPISGRASLTARGAAPGFGVCVADVRVDPDTGRTDVLRFTSIQDAGKAIHPDYVEGQLQGGAVQGIGWALNEEYVYDEQGRQQNPGFLDYRIPVASDVPMIDTVIVEVPNPRHPYGVRGVGETPIVGPLAAVGNAVNAATGLELHDLPLAPHKVLAALQARG
jgi:CO/xanthine dehydrogenase Mo-binding subunit